MSLRTAAWGLGLALLVGLLTWRSGVGSEPLRYYAPERYVERADAFIKNGYLAADCSQPLTRLVPILDQAPPHEQSWYRDSYLSADVARFNADPEGFAWAFVVDNDCRLRGVNPVVHAIELPFGRRIRWLGEILYSGEGSDAVLRSARRSITLRRSDRPISTQEQAWTRVGSPEQVLKEGVVMLHFAGGRSQPAARVFHVGDEVVADNRVRAQTRETVRLMGHQLPVGTRVRLETGDWLSLFAEKPRRLDETFVFVGGETLETASAVRRQNQRFERRTEDPGLGLILDPARDRSFPFLDQVAKSLDRGLAALPEATAERLSDSFDVQLSLRRDVQRSLSSTFGAFCSKVRDRLRLGRPFPAGMTVIDGLSGEILALATYPDEPALARDAPDDPRQRRRLLENQNLVRHPIGSAIKPFFFAAIGTAHPELMTLTIEGHEPAERHADLLHCELPTGYQLLDGHGVPIDLRTALEVSCNKYTVELATLALAADAGGEDGVVRRDPEVEWPLPGRTSGIAIGGRPLAWAPFLGEYVERRDVAPRDPESTAAARCSTVDRFEHVRYRRYLESITGAATYRGRVPRDLPADATRRQLEQGYTTHRWDLEPWRAVLEHLSAEADEEAAWKVRAALREISPERVNLAFNQVTRLRGDYLSLLLGGGTSVWTNLQLAEALSRLVTAREVDVRLAARVLERDGERRPTSAEATPLGEPLEVGAAARERVLEGLARVVTGAGGTAKPLRDELAAVRKAFPGEWIGLYSKTGSPVIERAVPAATGQLLEGLVARGRVKLEAEALVVAVGGAQTPYRPPGDGGRPAFEAALERAIADVGFRTHARRFLPVVRRTLDRFERDRRDPRIDPLEIDGPIQVETGALRLDRDDRLFRQNLVPGMAAVYVFSLVRLPAGASGPVPTAEDLAHPQARVITVALHLEADEASELAVEAAEAILPEVATLLR